MTTKGPTVDKALIQKALEWGLLKSLAGKSFCMTGAMSITRQAMQDFIMALGGEKHDAVKKGTTYLIIPSGDNFRKSSKYRAAQSNGVECITEEEFGLMILPTLDELLG